MAKSGKENSGNREYYAGVFRAAFQRTMMGLVQKENAIVCMKCRRYIRVGELPDECCRKFGFVVDPKSVIIDETTGKVTQASPMLKGNLEDA